MTLISDIVNNKKSVSIADNDVPEMPKNEGTDVRSEEAVKSDSNKWGYTKSQMDNLSNLGYTPERLDYFLSPFDPGKGDNFLQRMFEASNTKPKEIDERRLQRAKNIGSISDSLGLIAQMWSLGKGAHVSKRNPRDLAMSKMAEQEQDLRNIYRQESNSYNQGMFNARLKDYLKNMEEYNAGRKSIYGVLDSERKVDEAKRKHEKEMELKRFELLQKQSNADRTFELKKYEADNLNKYRNEQNRQGWERISDTKNRTTAYIRKTVAGGNGYQMIINGDPNDKTAQKDEFGNSVKIFDMTQGQVDQYARRALSDKDFINRHPELVLQRPNIEGSGQMKYRPNIDIAATYLQEIYERKSAKGYENPYTVQHMNENEELDEWEEYRNN